MHHIVNSNAVSVKTESRLSQSHESCQRSRSLPRATHGRRKKTLELDEEGTTGEIILALDDRGTTGATNRITDAAFHAKHITAGFDRGFTLFN